MTDRTPTTSCSPRNRIECNECDEVIQTEQRNKRTVQWGFWDADTQNFQHPTRQEHYCPECWNRKFARDAAAHYEVENAQRLWDILTAADGRLVADLGAIFVGGRPWIRIRNGEIEAIGSARRMVETDGNRTIQFGYQGVDVDREWFNKTFRAERDLPDHKLPTVVLLKPADETPFAEHPNLDPEQTTFEEALS